MALQKVRTGYAGRAWNEGCPVFPRERGRQGNVQTTAGHRAKERDAEGTKVECEDGANAEGDAGERHGHERQAALETQERLPPAAQGSPRPSHRSRRPPDHELPAGAEECIDNARKDGRIKTDERRKSRELCVGNGGRNLNRGYGDASDQIGAKVFRAIRRKKANVRHPQLPKRVK
jgi:hypothetical protein